MKRLSIKEPGVGTKNLRTFLLYIDTYNYNNQIWPSPKLINKQTGELIARTDPLMPVMIRQAINDLYSLIGWNMDQAFDCLEANCIYRINIDTLEWELVE